MEQLRESVAVLLPSNIYEGRGPADLRISAYRMLLDAVRKMAAALRDNQYRQFDPLVGECACQLRAFYLARHTTDVAGDLDPLLAAVDRAEEQLRVSEQQALKNKKKEISVKDLVEGDASGLMNLRLTPEQMYFVECHLLTHTKVIAEGPNGNQGQATAASAAESALTGKEYTDGTMLSNVFKVSKKLSNDVVKVLRKRIAHESVRFLQGAVGDIGYPSRLFHDPFNVEHNGLSCLPALWSVDALLRYGVDRGVPLVFTVKGVAIDMDYQCTQAVSFFLRPTDSGYQVTAPSGEDLDKAVVVFEGITARQYRDLPGEEEWTEALASKGLTELILASLATHVQYPCGLEDHRMSRLTESERELYLRYQDKSNSWGCSLQNPSLYLATHIFAERLGNLRLGYEKHDLDQARRLLDKGYLLKSISLFASLEDDLLEEVSNQLQWRELTTGQQLFAEGDPPDGLYILSSGTVHIANKQRHLATLGHGEFFGEIGALTGELRTATAIVAEPGKALYVDQKTLDNNLKDFPGVTRALIRTIVGYLRKR